MFLIGEFSVSVGCGAFFRVGGMGYMRGVTVARRIKLRASDESEWTDFTESVSKFTGFHWGKTWQRLLGKMALDKGV